MDLTVADLWRAKIATELYADKLMNSSIEYRNNGEDTYADNYEDGAEAYARLSDRFHKAYRSAPRHPRLRYEHVKANLVPSTEDVDVDALTEQYKSLKQREELWAKQGGN